MLFFCSGLYSIIWYSPRNATAHSVIFFRYFFHTFVTISWKSRHVLLIISVSLIRNPPDKYSFTAPRFTQSFPPHTKHAAVGTLYGTSRRTVSVSYPFPQQPQLPALTSFTRISLSPGWIRLSVRLLAAMIASTLVWNFLAIFQRESPG